MNSALANNLYKRLLTINKAEFEAGFYDAAYHSLMSALHLAEEIESDEPLLAISKIALEQNDWIDRNHPEYEHSTHSVAKYKLSTSIFTRLSEQALTIIKFRKIRGSI